jgi:glycerophosphoryl diester phosphodiesterase
VIPPQVIAHRGSSERHPDNSWPAFKAALAEGADAIECDVQATREGELVIHHDLEIDGRLLADHSLDDLRKAEPGTVRFEELLAWAERVPIGLLVEIKDPDIAEAVAERLAQTRNSDRITVGGFHGPALARAKARAPGLRTSLMVGSVVGSAELVGLARAYAVNGVHPCWEARAPRPHQLLDRAAVGRLHEAGLSVTLWHEERPSELSKLLELGADAICTNSPERLRQIIDQQSRARHRAATMRS